MNTHITTPRHFRLYGAVLAMAALLAVLLAATLTAGTTQAQVDGGKPQDPRIGKNTVEYSQPYPCSEEAQPDASTVGEIRNGYYAVFDAFWDYEVGHLSNNFCPPGVTVTTEEDDEGEEVTVYTRTDANIHISETVFSIPDSYKVKVIDSRAETVNGNPGNIQDATIDIADFLFLAENGAVSAVEPGPNDTTVFADNTLWWVRLDQPWTTNVDETSPLQVGFSTGLLAAADWNNPRGGDPVQFRFSAVHVLKDGTPVEAHVLGAHMFAFDQRTTDTPIAAADVRWSNVQTIEASEIGMQTGQYLPMQFAFTQPGTYRVQVNVEGHVQHTPPAGASKDWKPVSSDKTITSPVQWYTFHVGSEADLSTQVTAGAVSGSSVPITVTATNSGPNGAENVEVEISLPYRLSAPATLPSGASSNGCGVIAWEIGAMASGASRTLNFNASVATATTGKRTTTAEIRSTTFDPDLENNAASADVTLPGNRIRPPFFPGVTRNIVEHAIAGTHAGDPVAAVSPDGRALTYDLSGECSNWFQVHPNGQIVLAAGRTLDYEKQWEFPLTLHVTDGVNPDGPDTSYDDSTPVTIRVIDTPNNTVHPTVTFTVSDPGGQQNFDINRPKVGQSVNVTATVHNAPSGQELTYIGWTDDGVFDRYARTNVYHAYGNRVGTVTYSAHVKWPGGGITASKSVQWYPKE